MRFSLINRLSLRYLFTLILLVLFAFASFQSVQRLQLSVAAAEHTKLLIARLQTLLLDLLDAETGAYGYVAVGLPEFLAPYHAAVRAVPGTLEAISGEIDPGPQSDRLIALRQRTNESLALFRSLTEAPNPDAPLGSFNELLQASKASMDQARGLIDEMTQAANGVLAEQQTAAVDDQRLTDRVLLFGGVLLVLTSAALDYPLLRSLRRRLATLAEGARRLGEGELGHRVKVGGRDEISALARDFNRMAFRLQESNAALDAFAYTVSHDLRAPLRSMQGFSKALLEDFGPELGDTGRDYATRVVAAAARMDELIQDLLAYSRLSRTDIALTDVPLDETVDVILQRMSGVIGDRQATIKVDRPLPTVKAHRATLQQTLINLVNNALKFMPAGRSPEIRIRTEPRDDRVRIWIEDNGIGIAPEHHERIFRVFERLHGAETYPGTGIGLAIVKKGIERMEGQVGVQSAAGEGARFWFELRKGDSTA
jgi:signal transduction histidine kinase